MHPRDAHRRKHGRESTNHTWYFSGDDSGPTIHHGVGIIARNELRNHIKDIHTANERLMTITLNGENVIHVRSIDAPTADFQEETKEAYYAGLPQLMAQHRRRGVTYTLGDFNAKLGATGETPENGIGRFVYGINICNIAVSIYTWYLTPRLVCNSRYVFVSLFIKWYNLCSRKFFADRFRSPPVVYPFELIAVHVLVTLYLNSTRSWCSTDLPL